MAGQAPNQVTAEDAMRVFLTGGTGYVGSAVVRALVATGHQVTGLVRSDEAASALTALGGTAVRGDLANGDVLRKAAMGHEAVVHLGFAPGPQAVATDRTAVERMVAAATASDQTRSLVYTSGVMVLGHTGDTPADESASTARAAQAVAWRPAHERLVLDAATDRLATAVIRPGMVYGGKGGLIGQFFATAVEQGAAAYIGDGGNRWALVHRDDLARLYRLVIERQARGIFHGVDGQAIRVVELARAASEAAGKGGAIHAIPLDEARRQMGPFADALCLDQVVESRRSRDLGWRPERSVFLPAGAAAAFEEWNA